MSPITHLFASWIVAASTTDNPRDCRLVALAGIVPDLDGLGVVVDLVNQALGNEPTFLYGRFHHLLLHGVFSGLAIAAIAGCFARRHLRVALLTLAVFHLHLLCDLVGSRGPSPEDLWPIHYLAPFSFRWTWFWQEQWRLDGWPNRLVSVVLFAGSLWLAVRVGHSFVGVFSRRLDHVFVRVLGGWYQAWASKRTRPARGP
jgi:inner membrane protein